MRNCFYSKICKHRTPTCYFEEEAPIRLKVKMGGKDSKLSVISYEDACRRVTEAEIARLREAFRRATNVNSAMSESVFVREVLWDGVPTAVAQLIYRGYGGTSKGLSFKDLLCGLVILTKGTNEEKMKMIFGMYCDDSCTFVQKDEMDRRVLESEKQISPALSTLFRESDQVSFETFSSWLRLNPEATIISKWLLVESGSLSLSGEHDTPTFYQTLAGVTHLGEREILELEKRYEALKLLSKTGRFDIDLLKSHVSPPLPNKLCESLFLAFDVNCDNHIDFKEMACGISACCRGPMLERQKFCFKVFDMDHDLCLNEQEVISMLQALNTVRTEYNSAATLQRQDLPVIDPHTVAKEILSCHDTNHNGYLTMEDYLMWTVNNQLTTDFLQLLSQICHIVLGLSPQTKEEEGKIIQQWLERENRKPLEAGQVWYLINMQWWNLWLDYVNAELDPGGHPHRHGRTSRHQQTTSLGWEDDAVLMAGSYRAGGDNHTHRLAGSNLASHDLNPAHRSPSMSPKVSRKNGSGSGGTIQKPPAINNNPLLVNPSKYSSITNEGGRLRKDTTLLRGKDFEIVPECIWRALTSWYGNSVSLPRSVINSVAHNHHPVLELYPICVKIIQHQTPSQRPPPATTITGMMAGIGGMALSNLTANPTQPRRYHAYTASFSRKHSMHQIYEFLGNKLRYYREDFRLWKINSKDDQILTLLEDEEKTVEMYAIEDLQQILLEVRNKDLTWPEEMSQLAKHKTVKKVDVPTQKGATGLNNLGNTCFMNAALQCVSNTRPLTDYFYGKLHLFELNRDNPLGMKGHIAQRYGELVKDLWSGTSRTVAPLKLRWTIGKYAPRFNGFQQHDSQELLSFLLDGLHEDLNRVHNKPYVELKDSDGRPDRVVAREAWENHLLRNQSIVVDLFHGILKSQVRCKECGHVSVRFDPYSHLSLPLPMDSCIHLEVLVQKLDGSVPVKYGLRLNMDEKYRALKREVSQLSAIPVEELLIVEVSGPFVKSLPRDEQKIRTLLVPGSLFLYQLPPPPLIQPMTEEEEESGAGPGGLTSKPLATSDQQNGSRESLDLPEVQRLSTLDPAGIPAIVSSGEAPPTGPRSPCHSRSPSNVSIVTTEASRASDLFETFIIGVHRKINLLDLYYLAFQKSRPSLFGTPIIIPRNDGTTNEELYQFVWLQIARLVSPVPPSELKIANHAQDCDDSLGYEYPFILKEVKKDGISCAKCPWYRFCRGCKVECNKDLFGRGSSFLAIDWEATALHLRYQTTQEKYYEEHESVAASRQKQTEPIDLDTCLQAFTQWEELDEDQLYYCSKCKAHCLASKKLDIWRLPPILIINLKRFQYLNGRWVKSHKIVNFPLQAFDPSAYLAQRDPTSPTDVSSPSTKSVFPPLSTTLSNTSSSSSSSSVLSSSTSCAVAHQHSRLQQVEQYHQQDEQSSGDVSVSSSSSYTSNSFDSSSNLPTSAASGALSSSQTTPHSSTSAKPSDSEPLSAAALMRQQSTGRVSTSGLSTSSAGSGSMLGHVTTITVDASIAKQGQINSTNHQLDSTSRPSSHSIPTTNASSGSSSSTTEGATTVAKLAHVAHRSHHQSSQQSSPLRAPATQPSSNTDSALALSVKPQANGAVKAGRDSLAIAARLRGFDTEDYTNVKYNLYAMSCHTGILGGGHYVAYAKNEHHKWFVYNDSSCKEIPEGHLDKNSAYILFYEREGVDFNRFMPDTTGREPDLAEIDDEFESDFKKMCVLQ